MDERNSEEANYSSSDDDTHDVSLPPPGKPTEPTAASYSGHIISFGKISFLCAIFLHIPVSLLFRFPHQIHVRISFPVAHLSVSSL
jgi:hypothetical protein